MARKIVRIGIDPMEFDLEGEHADIFADDLAEGKSVEEIAEDCKQMAWRDFEEMIRQGDLWGMLTIEIVEVED